MHYIGCHSAQNAIFFFHGYNQSGKNASHMIKDIFTNDVLENSSLIIFFPDRHWFTYLNDDDFSYNTVELHNSQNYVDKLLSDKSYHNIGVIGYSQGACIAMDHFVRHMQNNNLIPTLLVSGFNANFSHSSSHMTRSMWSKTREKLWTLHGDKDYIIPIKMAHDSYSEYTDTNYVLPGEDHWAFWGNKLTINVIHSFIDTHFN
jgi:predicted esterase